MNQLQWIRVNKTICYLNNLMAPSSIRFFRSRSYNSWCSRILIIQHLIRRFAVIIYSSPTSIIYLAKEIICILYWSRFLGKSKK